MSVEEKLLRNKIFLDERPHITVTNKENCKQCDQRACLYVCPVKAFKLEEGELVFECAACIECGACGLACERKLIQWNYPRGGYGIMYRYG